MCPFGPRSFWHKKTWCCLHKAEVKFICKGKNEPKKFDSRKSLGKKEFIYLLQAQDERVK